MFVTEYCVDECKRQMDYTIENVQNMFYAFHMSFILDGYGDLFSIYGIKMIGMIVKPTNNLNGFRKTPVVFSNGDSGIHHSLIERTLKNLLVALEEGNITSNEFYIEFERIHPFEDGNGRVGSILWNVLNGNRNNPEIPQDFFGEK